MKLSDPLLWKASNLSINIDLESQASINTKKHIYSDQTEFHIGWLKIVYRAQGWGEKILWMLIIFL